jgi:hypothetical protein
VEEINQSVEFFLAEVRFPNVPMNEKVFVIGDRMSAPTIVKRDRFPERFKRSLVHVWRCFGDIPQARHPKTAALAWNA